MDIDLKPYLCTRMGEIINIRTRSPWLWRNFIFDQCPLGRQQKEVLKVLHGFSRKVCFTCQMIVLSLICSIKIIEERLANFNLKETTTNGDKKNARRSAFLDNLLAQMRQEKLTLDDVQEEVDTFMFEGHDTTAAALTFFCYLMGCYPDVQAKVHAELDSIFGGSVVILFFDDIHLFIIQMIVKENVQWKIFNR